MSESKSVRDFIFEFLQKELIGPSPGYPAVQPNGEEILRNLDPPRLRYSAGILFPKKSNITKQEETTEEEETYEESYSDYDEDIPVDESQPKSHSHSMDIEPDTDMDASLANEYLPSAMGLSALVELPNCLLVDVETATYSFKGYQFKKDGVPQNSEGWWREPICSQIKLYREELVGVKTVKLRKPVYQENGVVVLALYVESRPHEKSDSNRMRLITFTLINCRESKNRAPQNSECFFQTSFRVASSDDSPVFCRYPEKPREHDNASELSLKLLYLHHGKFSIGHGCAADWDEFATATHRVKEIRTEVMPSYEVRPVLPREIEGLHLRMRDLSNEDSEMTIHLCKRLCVEYERWIEEKEIEITHSANLESELRETATRHLKNCRNCLHRMREGVELLEESDQLSKAFWMMNEAMLMQQIHYHISVDKTREWEVIDGKLTLKSPLEQPNYDDPNRTWRPFQLAFILMNIKSVSEPNSDERNIVDVIWFPTGGGKTEAYLGLSAFSMFLRRLRNPEHAGTSVLMRYTLRLLTTQQFQRAASLICSCEVIRRKNVGLLGQDNFTIGLWVGSEVTPNYEKTAVEIHNRLLEGEKDNKFIFLSCPWCGAEMGPKRVGQIHNCKGYKRFNRPERIRFVCDDTSCDFSCGDGLPLTVIDEQIYNSPPTMLIGTVDKFAMLPFLPQARKIFGLDTDNPPPDLIIQDELHLISGPLGSMIGLYETVVDVLCRNKLNGIEYPAKIIASTATISQAESQVNGLYGRKAFLFPPQAIKAGDSFFAEEKVNEDGRLYVGVFATALPSFATAQIRTMGTILQAPALVCDRYDYKDIDPYWTMMSYFNNLRELGHAATLIRANIKEYLIAIWSRLETDLKVLRDKGIEPRRFLKPSVELTSRVRSSEITEIFKLLFKHLDTSPKSEVVDVCLATNMIQVGLDIQRLSLMTIVGQPKSTSEYIQASSRVGRKSDAPGLVVVNYNPSRPRDRSHYEDFRSFHQEIYRHVEPTSVTPFATPVRERVLHALIVILCRFWGDSCLRESPDPPLSSELKNRIRKVILDRVKKIEPTEVESTENMFDSIIQNWEQYQPKAYGGFSHNDETLPLLYPYGKQTKTNWDDSPLPYSTQSSMRNVDATCEARLLRIGYGDSTKN